MRNKKKRNLFILLLTYKLDHCQGALEALDSLIPSILPYNIESKFLIIDNACSKSKGNFNGISMIPGDNKFAEFSGWQKGLNLISETVAHHEEDLILFVNDSFHRSYGTEYLHHFPIVDEKVFKQNLIYGHFDDFPKKASVCNLKYQSWLRSNFFLCSFSTINLLTPLTLPHEPNTFFSENPNVFWSSTSNLSANFKAYILHWLAGKLDPNFSEYKLKWAKSGEITEENIKKFQLKALAIVCEHYLGAKIENSSILKQDINPMPKKENRHTKDYYEQIRDFYST